MQSWRAYVLEVFARSVDKCGVQGAPALGKNMLELRRNPQVDEFCKIRIDWVSHMPEPRRRVMTPRDRCKPARLQAWDEKKI